MDMEGKIVLITGSTSGIGLETARQLYRAGATIILTCRDEVRGRKAIESVQAASTRSCTGKIHLFNLNLLCYTSVLEFCQEIRSHFEKLDVLICNAGIMGLPFELSSDGIEAHFATNQFGHFVMVNHLLPLLESSRGRIIVISSGLYKAAEIVPSVRQLMGEDNVDYDSKFAYSFSKLANCLYTVELAKRLEAVGSNVKVFAIRPGFVRGTELGRETHWLLRSIASPLIWLFSKSLEQGSEAIVQCSSINSEELTSGKMYSSGQEEDYGPMVTSYHAAELWDTCCSIEDTVLKRCRLPDDVIESARAARNLLSS